MIGIFTVALAAGAASALMFASTSSGVLVSLLLAYFAPLPLIVAALGWGPLAGAVSGIVATIALTALPGMFHGFRFALTGALPAWWLGYLALLGRPVAAATPGNAADLEWYPVGRILLWIAIIATLTAVAILWIYSVDVETIAEPMRQLLSEIARQAEVDWTPEQIASRARLFGYLSPLVFSANAALMWVLNLWLAAKVALTSGRLHRPWPDVRSVMLPPITLAILAVAIAFCFFGGWFAMLAGTVVGALLFAYAVVGFAVVHVLTLSASNRTFRLTCAYVVTVALSLVLSGIPVLVMAALGIADAVLGLRQRFLQTRPPPLPAE
ncbi:heme exporter protein D [Bradyrhizobium sp. USDA 4454]